MFKMLYGMLVDIVTASLLVLGDIVNHANVCSDICLQTLSVSISGSGSIV